MIDRAVTAANTDDFLPADLRSILSHCFAIFGTTLREDEIL